MSEDLAALVRDATPEARANLRAALDAADQAVADADQLSQEQLRGMTPKAILDAHHAGRLRKLTGNK